MKRWLRIIFNWISAVVCVATIAIWIMSYFSFDAFDYVNPEGGIVVAWPRGTLVIGKATGPISIPSIQTGFHHYQSPPENMSAFGLYPAHDHILFGYGQPHGGQNGPISSLVYIKCWIVALVTVLFPAEALLRYGKLKRLRLRAQNRCVNCGYDLRATPDRCPECGTVPQHDPAPIPSGSQS